MLPPEPDEYAKRGTWYAERVVSGEIPAGRYVRLACQRQLDDLEKNKSPDSRWEWVPEAGEEICRLAELMPHVKGRWRSPTIQLEDWQCFLFTVIFGWKDRQTGLRRFRKALTVTPRKNAKTAMAAIVALYLFAFDGEPGAEVYSAATSRDQAALSWDTARRMCDRQPAIKDELGIETLAHAIVNVSTNSTFRALSRDAHSLEGLNVHGAIIDELHAHKTREVFDVIDDATGSRQQPLLFIISTEGDDNEGVFAEQVTYLHNILNGAHQDESYFGIYYSLDPGDDWTLEASWQKANPNYGVSVFAADMEARCKQAIQNPGSQSSFLTKRLNVRVGAAESYFNMLAWNGICKVQGIGPEDLIGEPCMMAIDMAAKSDLTSKVIMFRASQNIGKLIKAGHFYVFTRNYLPAAATQPGKPNYELYREWIAKDAITVTDGDVTDYDHLEQDLLEDVRLYKPGCVGIDPNYNAAQFTNNMRKGGVRLENVAHNVQNFTNPFQEIAADITAGRIHHNGDPVLTWAIGNVTAKANAKGDLYPAKSRESNKIDPAVALIAAKSLQLRIAVRRSVYESGMVI